MFTRSSAKKERGKPGLSQTQHCFLLNKIRGKTLFFVGMGILERLCEMYVFVYLFILWHKDVEVLLWPWAFVCYSKIKIMHDLRLGTQCENIVEYIKPNWISATHICKIIFQNTKKKKNSLQSSVSSWTGCTNERNLRATVNLLRRGKNLLRVKKKNPRHLMDSCPSINFHETTKQQCSTLTC